MPNPLPVDDLNRRLASIRGWARDVNIDGPWPTEAAANEGSNWKVQIYPTKRPSITSCISVVDAVEDVRSQVPVVDWAIGQGLE